MTTARTTICIFAKPPIAGAAKTRLIPHLGDKNAALVARALIADAVAAASAAPDCRVLLSTSGPFPSEAMPELAQFHQPQGDLGTRIEATLQHALRTTPIALAIGADTFALSPERIESAVAALACADAVIGPAADGGFWLLGLRSCPRGLLQGIAWSHPETCNETLAALRRHKMNTAALAPWFDVDTAEDLQRARLLLGGGRACAPHLAALMEQLFPSAGERP